MQAAIHEKSAEYANVFCRQHILMLMLMQLLSVWHSQMPAVAEPVEWASCAYQIIKTGSHCQLAKTTRPLVLTMIGLYSCHADSVQYHPH